MQLICQALCLSTEKMENSPNILVLEVLPRSFLMLFLLAFRYVAACSRLALNWSPSCLSLPCTGIVGQVSTSCWAEFPALVSFVHCAPRPLSQKDGEAFRLVYFPF